MENYNEALRLEIKYKRYTTRTKHASNDKVCDILSKRYYRLTNPVPTMREFCDNLIIDRLNKLADALPDSGYSMGEYKRFSAGKMVGIRDNTENYANSCKWSPTHGNVHYNIKLKNLKHWYVIGGVATYIYPNQKRQIRKCFWLSSEGNKQFFELTTEKGYIVGGRHAYNYKCALTYLHIDTETKKQAKQTEKQYKAALRKQYTFADSQNAGHCLPGALIFCRRVGIDPGRKYRGAYLLKLARTRAPYAISYLNQMFNNN